MSHPRQILPGSTYFITRRCSERRYFLRPQPATRSVFGYLLAVAAGRYDVEPHCAVVMGNHYHAVVTDWSGKLPRFVAWLHRLVAVAMNVFLGRWEAFWSSEKPNFVRLETPADTLDKMVYVLTNAVAAGLVPRASEWPGFATDPAELEDAAGITFRRPDWYFDPNGKMPEVAQLRFTKPPGFDHLTDAEFVALLRERLRERERRLFDALVSSGRRFAGPARAAAVHWADAPSTPAPRRGRVPHLAARDSEVRLRAIARLRAFRAAYRRAILRLRRGKGPVTFPAGTYALRHSLGVACHDPPESICWKRAA